MKSLPLSCRAVWLLTLVVSWLSAVSGATAGEASGPALSLLTADSLIGWDYGSSTAGWSRNDGALLGSRDSAPLVAGWTLGDFELTLNVKLSDEGELKLAFPLAPPVVDRIADPYIRPQLDVVLSGGAGGCRLYDGQRLLALSPGRSSANSPTRFTLTRAGDVLSLAADDKQLWKGTIGRGRLGLEMSVTDGKAEISQIALAEPAGEPIFNGRNLSGWHTADPKEAWIVRGEELVCTGQGRDYLRYDQPQENFILSLEYNLSRRGNSGIGIRTPPRGWPSGDGIELQLYDEPAGTPLSRHSTLALYGNLEPLVPAERAGQWNQAVVRAEGYIISGWINGALVQHANTYRMPELKYRNLQGWIGLQNHHSPIQFRNIRLTRLPAGRGMPAWYGPRGETASEVVLDRLMNSERLSRSELAGQSGTIVRRIEKTGPIVLAEIKGPAALVELAAVGASPAIAESQLAFYFDEEQTPRIRCAVRDLEQHVPPVSEGGLPVATFLGFQKHLKVALDARGAGEYRIDYVALPASLPLETFHGREQSVTRGMLPAISYRLDHMDSGRVREYDHDPKFAARPRTIEPGATVELIQVPDAGIVDWWELFAPQSVLASDDLQVLITPDGAPEPAIQAPARFLFAGLAGRHSWHNFVLTLTDEPTSRLAMPFARGISIAVKNTGQSPISSVGCKLSVSTDRGEPADRRLRLHGQWISDSSAEGELFKLAGAGRWVGIVWQPAPGPAGELVLTSDDNPQPNWRQSVDCFFGFGGTDEVRKALSGRADGLAWRYLLLSPVEYRQSLVLRSTGKAAGRCLVLYYGTK